MHKLLVSTGVLRQPNYVTDQESEQKPYEAHVNVLSQPCLGHLLDKRWWKCLLCRLEGGEETLIISHLSSPEGWMKEMRKG